MSFNYFNHFNYKTFHLSIDEFSGQSYGESYSRSFKVTFSPRSVSFDKTLLLSIKTLSELFNFFETPFDNSKFSNFGIILTNITTHFQNFSSNPSLKNKDICILKYDIISFVDTSESTLKQDSDIISEKDLRF